MEKVKPESVGFSSERLARIRLAMQRHLDQGRYAGMITLAVRRGKIAHFEQFGMMDLAAGKPMAPDAIFRIYSMTKPITSVAALMLMEEGLLHLNDPVSAFIPALKDLSVIARVEGDNVELEAVKNVMTIRHLFTHTAGFSYGFDENDYLDRLYQKQLWKKLQDTPGESLKDMIEALSTLPLRFQPGTRFHYSVSIDVLGHIVEIVSGLCLDEFFQQRIFEPLGMVDTAFWVGPEKAGRLAHNYGPDVENPGRLVDIDPHEKSNYLKPATFFSGGGGLVSTTFDYLRFCQMLLNGGELDGVRLLGRKTVELMRSNHLPAGIYEDANCANGFGLGGYVLLNPGYAPCMGSFGNWGWGGAAGTRFWLDFQEQLIGILMVQVMPSDLYPLGDQFQNLVYQALVE